MSLEKKRVFLLETTFKNPKLLRYSKCFAMNTDVVSIEQQHCADKDFNVFMLVLCEALIFSPISVIMSITECYIIIL